VDVRFIVRAVDPEAAAFWIRRGFIPSKTTVSVVSIDGGHRRIDRVSLWIENAFEP